jgi:hypothetical protein
MAFIGNGAQLTDLDAGDIASGTLPVARGGTGTASPSLVGGTNITISGSWPNQTVTAAGGGVTSLNGQTGAITNTSLFAIGSYITGRPKNVTNYSTNATIAGSSLWAAPTLAIWAGGKSNIFLIDNSGYNNAVQVNTGTWRCVSPAESTPSRTDRASSGLWVRIS